MDVPREREGGRERGREGGREDACRGREMEEREGKEGEREEGREKLWIKAHNHISTYILESMTLHMLMMVGGVIEAIPVSIAGS